MGCAPLFCCFKNCRPNSIAFTALIVNVIAFAFLIWGLADIEFSRNSAKALYIIAFIFLALSLIALILILIFLNLRNGPSYITFNNIGKILCLLIILFCIIAIILFVIAEIFLIYDYDDLEKMLGKGRNIPRHDWAAVILPGILGIISSVIVALCANVLYKIFNDNILTTVSAYQNNPVNLNQISTTTVPNITQDQVVVTGNNVGAVPPMVPNNQPQFPVYVQQSGMNINMK